MHFKHTDFKAAVFESPAVSSVAGTYGSYGTDDDIVA